MCNHIDEFAHLKREIVFKKNTWILGLLWEVEEWIWIFLNVF
jgi:hypothetical protein